MKKTKQKIVDQAILLFNKYGIASVRLQQIADACGISIGNLGYHFRLKEKLLFFIAEYIEQQIDPMFSQSKPMPHLIDFDNQLSLYFDLVNRYSFYFLDVLELEKEYAIIHKKRVSYIHKMIDRIRLWLEENERNNILKAEIHEGQYEQLAEVLWMVIIFWMTQKKIRCKVGSAEEEFKLLVWNQLLPNFTELGLMEYEALILPQFEQVKYEFFMADRVSR